MIACSGLHEGNVKTTEAEIAIENAVVSLTTNETLFEAIAAYNRRKWIFGPFVEARYFGICASEQGRSAAGTSTLQVDKSMGNLRYGVAHESPSAVQVVLFTIIEQKDYGAFGPIARLGKVREKLEHRHDAHAIVGGTVAGADGVVMCVDKNAAIIASAFSGVKGLVVVGAADGDNNVCSLKIDRSSARRKGGVGSQVIEHFNLARLCMLLGDDGLDALEKVLAHVIISMAVVWVEAAGDLLEVGPGLR